ncbi:MAG: TolC family protein, partial [Planktomarina sp.]
ARAEAEVSEKARTRLTGFVNIIQQRVDGGVSNMADLRVAQSKLQELRAEYTRARETEATSLAELNAMAQISVADIRGLSQVASATDGKFPLNVLKAQAEGTRTVAQARIDRAGMLPGITLGGTIGEGGNVGINASSDQLMSIGTGSALSALEASQDAARRGVAQAEEDNRRMVQRLDQRRISLQRQQGESQALVTEAKATLSLFYNQFQNSGRPIMDVVNIFENAMRLERDAVRLKYELAAIEVEIAGLYGLLVNGEDV